MQEGDKLRRKLRHRRYWPLQQDIFLGQRFSSLLSADEALEDKWARMSNLPPLQSTEKSTTFSADLEVEPKMPVTARFSSIKEDVENVVKHAEAVATAANCVDPEIFDRATTIGEKWCALAAYAGSYISFINPPDRSHFGKELLHESNTRRIEGVVIKAAMQKTVTVVVTRQVKHPVYGKRMKYTKKYLVHDEYNDCQVGDRIIAVEGKPLSKRKRHSFLAKVSSRSGRESERKNALIDQVADAPSSQYHRGRHLKD